ncbi:uncharacterized protein LOC122075165 isoform X2 [Macadamia integrifolia]|uniref:uncharacterized protein LOC122075165 isoform X2 n=1 Tax=Macadamia integrifolia TaxID=60698 RepID=UPI001C500906|nr:uncharacterized protein LOC122075165 isoform X2 [Macadamia integrifolia]
MSKLKVKRNTEDEKTVLPADMEADALPEKVEEKKTDMEIGKERPGVVGYEKYLTETGSKLASDQSKETSEAKPLTKEENYEVLEKQKIENREAAGDEAAESGDEGILEEGREAKPQGSQSPADKQSENVVRLQKETASDEGLLICRQYQMAKLLERKVWLMWNAGTILSKKEEKCWSTEKEFSPSWLGASICKLIAWLRNSDSMPS